MTGDPIRILGLTMERVADFRSNPTAKSSGLYAALDRRFNVVGVVRPELSRPHYYLNKLRHIHPNRDYWRSRAGLNPWIFRQRTLLAEQQIKQWHGQYDLIMQVHTLLAPGTRPQDRQYVLHTDSTYMLNERYYPEWAPLRSRQQRNAWIELERKTYQHAAFLFPRSDWLRRSLIEDYGCDPARVIRVGGGANLHAVSLEAKRYDRQIALFVGYDFERKGGATLLQAWDSVIKAVPGAELWIVGPKHQHQPDRPGVRWFGTVSDRQQLADMYAQATVFVMPALFEPWGHVFLEAMGQGLACIGTDRCAMPEIIEDGVTGALVPPGEPEPLAHVLSQLLGDPSTAAAMGHRAHAATQHGYSWDDVVARMTPYIQQAVYAEQGTSA